MKKKSRKNHQKWWVLCEWCGETKCSSRADRITCSGRCRQRMAAFVRELGWRPGAPPGPITAGAAIDIVIIELIVRERLRREADPLLCRRAGKRATLSLPKNAR